MSKYSRRNVLNICFKSIICVFAPVKVIADSKYNLDINNQIEELVLLQKNTLSSLVDSQGRALNKKLQKRISISYFNHIHNVLNNRIIANESFNLTGKNDSPPS